jgi:hypothetical protein
MAEATLTTVNALLKEVYGPRIEEQLQSETVALKRIERTSEGVVETAGGKYVDFPIRTKRNPAIGYRAETEPLPAAGVQGYAEVHVPLQYGYGRTRFTGQVMELAEKNYQAFASTMDGEMDGLKNDIVKDSNRVVYGDGSGLMATVTADGVNTVTVDNIQYLEVGQLVDIRTRSNGAAIAAARTITAINESTKVVTYSGADATATAADGIYRQDNYLAGVKREPSGFGIIVNDTSILHTLDPALEPAWKGIIRNNPQGTGGTPRALSEGVMIEAMDAVRTKGSRPTAIFCGLGVRRAYFNLLTQQRRYTDTKTFAGGFQGLPFMYGTEVPVVEDVDCPPNKMFFITENNLKVYRTREWHWEDKGGGILKWISGYDSFECFMKCYYEFGTSRRNSHALMSDIIEG